MKRSVKSLLMTKVPKIAVTQLVFLSVLLLKAAMPASCLTIPQIEDIFYQYDVPEEEAPDCQAESIDVHLCPNNERIPCGPVEGIKDHCTSILGGAESVKKFQDISPEEGKNALAGCIKYVGFHVFDLDHLACCESDICEDWMAEQFEKLSSEQPNADDDDYYAVDDDEPDDFHEEF
mmetsp:Transcript_15015/g.28257  ORF Transcript_15015/g.28257 Transcript_15015/m.28257 type:complete len:177 (+) Transcript_15015:119-649(+)